MGKEQELRQAVELWFFRDLADEQRYKLGLLVGLPGEAWPASQGHQRLFLRHILDALGPANPDAGRRDEQAGVVGWTGSGSLKAVSEGNEGYIWPSKADAHPIPLYRAPAVAAGGVTEGMVARAMAASASQYEVARKLQASSPKSYAECFGEATPPELAMRAALTAALAVGDEGIREGAK